MSENLAQRVRDLEAVIERHFDAEQHRLVAELAEIKQRRGESAGVREHHVWVAHQDHKNRLAEFDRQKAEKEAELEALFKDREPVERERDELREFLNRKAG